MKKLYYILLKRTVFNRALSINIIRVKRKKIISEIEYLKESITSLDSLLRNPNVRFNDANLHIQMFEKLNKDEARLTYLKDLINY